VAIAKHSAANDTHTVPENSVLFVSKWQKSAITLLPFKWQIQIGLHSIFRDFLW